MNPRLLAKIVANGVRIKPNIAGGELLAWEHDTSVFFLP